VPLRATRGEREDRVGSIRCLNRGLLIHAEYGRVLGRLKVEPDDVGRLLLEVRIVRDLVMLEAVRLDLEQSTFARPRTAVSLLAFMRRGAPKGHDG
jgi:hypothetical protein